jgi:ParB family transcriptional regulator, chromosome partitioning protein
MKTALGKGLDSLLPAKADDIIAIDIDRIIPGEQQPRKVFKGDALNELAASIREKGILQPIIVARTGEGTFRIVAGERRWRAASLAGLRKIPAMIKDVASEDSLEIALIENIQREDLSPIEMAEAFYRLMNDFRLTQEELSARVGKERATVANYLRLLKLPDEIKRLVNDETMSMGHARAILSIEGKTGQIEAARRIIRKGLSVREAEALAKRRGTEGIGKTGHAKRDPQIESIEERLIRHLGTKVRVHHRGRKGKIEIEYYSLDELDRLLEILTG